MPIEPRPRPLSYPRASSRNAAPTPTSAVHTLRSPDVLTYDDVEGIDPTMVQVGSAFTPPSQFNQYADVQMPPSITPSGASIVSQNRISRIVAVSPHTRVTRSRPAALSQSQIAVATPASVVHTLHSPDVLMYDDVAMQVGSTPSNASIASVIESQIHQYADAEQRPASNSTVGAAVLAQLTASEAKSSTDPKRKYKRAAFIVFILACIIIAIVVPVVLVTNQHNGSGSNTPKSVVGNTAGASQGVGNSTNTTTSAPTTAAAPWAGNNNTQATMPIYTDVPTTLAFTIVPSPTALTPAPASTTSTPAPSQATDAPTPAPTSNAPAPVPITNAPSAAPSATPTNAPTTLPSSAPATAPPVTATPATSTAAPTPAPSTAASTPAPSTAAPTPAPSTAAPTPAPTTTAAPTPAPTTTSAPTPAPTAAPTPAPNTQTPPPTPAPTTQPPNTHLQFSINAPATFWGYDTNAYSMPHSAGAMYESTMSYTVTNTGATDAYNVTLNVNLYAALNTVTEPLGGTHLLWSPMPDVVHTVTTYSLIPYQVMIYSLPAGQSQTIGAGGGFYGQPSGPYTVTWAMHYLSSIPPMLNQAAPDVSQNSVVSMPATQPPQTRPATTQPIATTAAVTATVGPSNLYNPGPLPAPAWNETATQTVAISDAPLHVLTQGGQGNFYRQHYYADPSLYISAAQALATNSLNRQIAPQWAFNTTLYVPQYIQDLIVKWKHPQVYRPQPLIWQNYALLGGDLNSLFSINLDNPSQYYLNQLNVPFNEVLSMAEHNLNCQDQIFEGVTGAGVVDLDTNTLYVLSKTYDPPTSTKMADATFYLIAMSLPDLTEQWRMEINNLQYRTKTFNAGWHQQRSSMLMLNGIIYIPFGAQCDYGDYRGWLVGVQISTRTVVHLWAPALGNYGAGLWGAGSGPSSDSNGRLFVVTGNSWGGHVSPGQASSGGDLPIAANTINWPQLDNSVVSFDTTTLHPVNFFTPYNSNYMDGDNKDGINDQDLGSSTLSILPKSWGTAQHPNIGVVGGKNSTLYLLDLDILGGYKMRADGKDAVISVFPVYSLFGGQNLHMTNSAGINVADGLIYVAIAGELLYAFKLVPDANGQPQLTYAGQSDTLRGVVSSGVCAPTVVTDGTPGNAIVWISYGQGVWGYKGVPDANGILQRVAFVGLYDNVGFFQPGFYNGGIIAGSSSGLIRRYQMR